MSATGVEISDLTGLEYTAALRREPVPRLYVPRPTVPICKVEGCCDQSPGYRSGLCAVHNNYLEYVIARGGSDDELCYFGVVKQHE